MDKSDQIGKLAKALANVQKQLKPALKDAKNPFYKSNYSTLNSVWDSCRDLLADNGLSVVQTNIPSESGVIIETILLHESDQWISGALYLPLAKHDPQGVGSAVTYGRRYALASMVGVVADEDDDGNSASRPMTKQVEQNGNSLAERIKKAQAAIKEKGGKVEPQAKGESDTDYFAMLTAQYQRLVK